MKQYLLITSLLFALTSFGQEVEFKGSNFKDNKEGYKKAKIEMAAGTELFSIGNEAVFLVRSPELNFKKALIHFEKAYNFNPKSADVNFKIGVCHFYSSNKTKCISYFKEAYKLNPETDPFMDYYIGVTQQLEDKYKTAIKSYVRFETNYRKADNFNKFVKKEKKNVNLQ